MEPEKVTVIIKGGMAEITKRTGNVEVTIIDYDNDPKGEVHTYEKLNTCKLCDDEGYTVENCVACRGSGNGIVGNCFRCGGTGTKTVECPCQEDKLWE